MEGRNRDLKSDYSNLHSSFSTRHSVIKCTCLNNSCKISLSEHTIKIGMTYAEFSVQLQMSQGKQLSEFRNMSTVKSTEK